MGENGGKTAGQVLSHGSCACLAWCSMSLAHIQRVGSAGLAVKDDRNGRCRKMLAFAGQGDYSKHGIAAPAQNPGLSPPFPLRSARDLLWS